VPNNPSTPRNTGKTNEPVAKMTSTEIEHKSLMLSYFPDTLSVGNEFLAYVEITKDNTVKFGNLNAGNNTYARFDYNNFVSRLRELRRVHR
jgi:hypothetical protein